MRLGLQQQKARQASEPPADEEAVAVPWSPTPAGLGPPPFCENLAEAQIEAFVVDVRKGDAETSAYAMRDQ